MTPSNSNPTSLLASNHPPLAHDAQGCKIAIPNGTTHWRILRCTPGRPKLVVGADGQPSRFPLELTHDELLDACGPGKFRLEALDEYGNALACVTSVSVGLPEAPVGGELVANNNNQRAYASNDMRIALETIAQLSRAHSESLQSLANAQADWIKTLATSKQIPRNVAMPFVAPAAASSDGDAAEGPSWFKLLQPAMPAIATAVIRNLGSWLNVGRPAEEPASPRPKYRNASALAAIADREKKQLASFDAQLAAVCEQLDPDEREPAMNAMRTLQPFYGSIFERMSLPQGVEFVRGLLKNDKTSQETSS